MSAASDTVQNASSQVQAARAGLGELSELVEALRAGRCVLCAGTRLYAGHTFREIVERLLAMLPEVDADEARRVLEASPLLAAGYVRRHLSDGFADALQRATATGAVPEVARLYAQLPFRTFVTTAFDDALERALGELPEPLRVLAPRDPVPVASGRVLLKALGSPSRPDTVLWSARDVAAAHAAGGYQFLIDQLARRRSLLLVGFDAHDPDLDLLLEPVLASATADVEHYAVLPGLGKIEREELRATHGIHILGESDPAQLAQALAAALGNQLRARQPGDDDIDGWLGRLGDPENRAEAEFRLAMIERKLRLRGEYERVVDMYLGRVDVEPDALRRSELLGELAPLFEHEMGDPARAFAALLEAYREAPQRRAWDELSHLAEQTGSFRELVNALEEAAPALPEADRSLAWLELARLHAHRLDEPGAALAALSNVENQATEDSQIVLLRTELLRRADRWPELVDALERQSEAQEFQGERARLLCEAADVCERRLSDPARAIVLYRRALQVDPWFEKARLELEALLRRRGERAELARLLEDKLEGAPREEQPEIRRELAGLYADALAQPARAIELYQELRAETPGDLEVLRALERLYEQAGRVAEHVDVLAAQAGVVESSRERADLYRRMAAEWKEQLGSSAQAAECLEWLLTFDGPNGDVFATLERMYRADRRWRAAIDAYCRHATIAEPEQRAHIFLEVGGIYEQEIKDPARAIDFYRKAEEALPGYGPALAALTRLYEHGSAWERAVETLERRAPTVTAASERAELYQRAGELACEQLRDLERAEQLFRHALETHPNHVPSMLALADLCRRRGEPLRAARLLLDAAPHLPLPLERARLLAQAAEIHERMHDPAQAVALYQAALHLDPDHPSAARVAQLLWEVGRYEELTGILDLLVRKPADVATQVERWTRLGRAARALGATAKAREAFAHAVELSPQDLEAQRGLGEILCELDQWAPARAALEQLKNHHLASLAPAERVGLHHRLGLCGLRMGEREAARTELGAALALDPAHRPTLLAQLELYEEEPQALVATKRALLETVPNEDKASLLTEIGDLWLHKLGEPEQALRAWREALAFAADSHRLLHKCLDLHVERKQWPEALATLERLAAIEKVAEVRARYRHAAAMICLEEQGDRAQAERLLAAALEDDSGHGQSAQALEGLLSERADWEALANHYYRLLTHFGEGSGEARRAQQLRLWSALGELCLGRLNDRARALVALEAAANLDPTDRARQERLARLFEDTGPAHREQAILRYQILLAADHERKDAYGALERLYEQTEQGHKAQACRTVVALFDQRAGDAVPYAPCARPLDAEAWARVQHPSEDRLLSALFAWLAPPLARTRAVPRRRLGLRRQERVGEADGRMWARLVGTLASSLGMAVPEAYLRPSQPEPVKFANCLVDGKSAPTLVLGAPMLQDSRYEAELRFMLGRLMAQLRPELLMRLLMPQPSQLAHLIEAVMALGHSPSEPPAELVRTSGWLERTLAPVALDQVRTIGQLLRAREVRAEPAALAWLQASDLTATRAAFLETGDLAACARLLAAEPAAATTLPNVQRVADLLWWSITEELFALRQLLAG